jgi:hypothetical protein
LSRAVVSVATARYYRCGLSRLKDKLDELGEKYVLWTELPPGCPPHREVPFAFKAVSLRQAADEGYTSLLWVDASILPIRPLAPLWEKIERDGYLLMNNGWSNYEWTADSAYPDLFPDIYRSHVDADPIGAARVVNRTIPHLVGGVVGLDMTTALGRTFLDEYYRLASTTRAFCGPWGNTNSPRCPDTGILPRGPCGPPDVLGHRHDQTAASVVAWRLGMKLTDSPRMFSYVRGNSKDPADYDPRTVLVDYGTD